MEPARLAEETIRQSAVPKTVHQRCQQGGQRFFHTVFRVGFVPILLGLLEFCRDDFVSAEDRPSTPLLKAFVDEFVAIRPGESRFPKSFEMGDNSGQPDERPRHQVVMAHSFSIAKYEVPQNLYEAVMGTNPGRWKGPRNSVEMTSWDDANEFCRKITESLKSQKLIADNEVVRLPTEAEWEYCCRAGTTTLYSFGDRAQKDGDTPPKATLLDEFAWHTGNAAGNDPPVGARKPNPWGLYDFHGYLWEFTADAWDTGYDSAPTDGSAIRVTDETRFVSVRGGSWKDGFEMLTSTRRRKLSRLEKDDAVGFRCVKSELAK